MISEVALFGLMNLHRMKRKITEDFDRSKSKRKKTKGEFHYNNEDKVHCDEISTTNLQNNEIVEEEEDEDEEIRRDLQRRRRSDSREEDEDASEIGIRAERSEEDAAEEEQTDDSSSSFREDEQQISTQAEQQIVFRDSATEAAQTEDRLYLVEEEGQRLFRSASNSSEQRDPSVRRGGIPVQNVTPVGQYGQPDPSETTSVPSETGVQIYIPITRSGDSPPAPAPAPAPAPVSILILNPDTWWYRLWCYFIIALAVFSSFFTPLEIAFFTDLPEGLLFIIDLVVAAAFFLDLGFQFFISYRDDQGLMVCHNRLIALRCLKSVFTYVDLLGCLPWDVIYVVCGREDGVRFCLWFRLYRAFRVKTFFQNIGINYRFIRFLKIFAILLYYVHIGGCIFYYLATILPESIEIDTWIGSLALGADHFREIDFGRRYLISLYFAVITLSTIGYGDIHAVSDLEMIFTVIYVLPSMVVVPYLVNYAIGDM